MRGSAVLLVVSVSIAFSLPVFAAEPVASTDAVASVTDTIDEVADKVRQKLLAEKARVEEKISALSEKEKTFSQSEIGQQINEATGGETVVATRPASTPGDTLKRVGWQLYRGAIVVALFILDHKIVLYLVLALILYKLIRFVFKRIVGRRVY